MQGDSQGIGCRDRHKISQQNLIPEIQLVCDPGTNGLPGGFEEEY